MLTEPELRDWSTGPVVGPDPAAAADLRRLSGMCYALFAYDIGLAIDLDEAQRRISAGRHRGALRQQRRTPKYFEYEPAPLRVVYTAAPLAVGEHLTEPAVEALIYDFGAVSVQYSIPLAGSLPGLLALSGELYDNPALLEASRRVVEGLLPPLASAVNKPDISDLVEDYALFHVWSLADDVAPAALVRQHAGLLAQILRSEGAPLSQQEVDDALGCQIAFGPRDLTLIDWNAALLLGRELDDVRAVLEYANVELLEMRFLDDRLDRALSAAFSASARASGPLAPFLDSKAADLSRIAELQLDSALLYEGVSNALKLLGDQYLARVHRLAAQRFHLTEWDSSIRRKLQTMESIYQKISDRSARRRAEVLEWIIILLIAAEIAMSLLGNLR